MSQMLASSDADFKAGVVKMLQQSITNAPEPQNLNNEIDVITKNQREITEQRTQKQTQTLAGWRRWQTRDNRELSRWTWGQTIGFVQSEHEREIDRKQKWTEPLRPAGKQQKSQRSYHPRPRDKEEERGAERVFEEIMVEISPNLA